jgi:hypothetical protein
VRSARAGRARPRPASGTRARRRGGHRPLRHHPADRPDLARVGQPAAPPPDPSSAGGGTPATWSTPRSAAVCTHGSRRCDLVHRSPAPAGYDAPEQMLSNHKVTIGRVTWRRDSANLSPAGDGGAPAPPGRRGPCAAWAVARRKAVDIQGSRPTFSAHRWAERVNSTPWSRAGYATAATPYARSGTVEDGGCSACQEFARIYATRNRALPYYAIRDSASHLRDRVGT